MKRKVFVLLLIVLITTLCTLCLSSCSTGVHVSKFGVFQYTVENEQVTITKYYGAAPDVTIPESIRGMPVVSIGIQAFESCLVMRSVSIPDSVVNIDLFAFNECYALKHVTLGRGLRTIHDAFLRCDQIIYNEYENGYYLGNDENPYLALVSVISRNAEAFTIHPDTVIICGYSLEGCSLLREIVFPENVISIGSYALQYCSSLETAYIPQSVEHIDSPAFYNCNNICEFVVSEQNPYFKAVDGSLFSYDGSILIKYALGRQVSSYRVPDGTVIIERSAFENSAYLTEVILPNSMEQIEHWAFLDCENMKRISFGNGLKLIGGQAFGNCTSLTEIALPDSLERLSYSAFSSCTKLETVVIGNGVTHIETEAFSGCDALSEVSFNDSHGWMVNTSYALSSDPIDLSDPKQNASYLTEEYCHYYWHKE